jgi:anti-sigma factor RsiW
MATTRRAMNCKELVELITDYLEDALPLDERARFEAHLAACEDCQHYLQQMRTTIRLTGTLTEDSLRGRAWRELLTVFRTWKQGNT